MEYSEEQNYKPTATRITSSSSSSSADIHLPSTVLGLQLAACPPWINVVYLVYSLITHVYFKSTTFLQGAADQAGAQRDTV